MPKRIEHRIVDGIELKHCGCCKEWIPLEGFSKHKSKWDGLQERCSICKIKHWQNVGKYTRVKPPKDVARKRHRKNVIKSYGITEDYFEELIKRQDNRCAICNSKEWGRPSPSIDHDHNTGKVRGLLCNRCNRALGMFGDNTVLLKNAIKYLKVYE